jgi:twitching motility protein PilT
VKEYILNADKTPLIHSVVAEGMTQYGMQTFDQSVLALLQAGLITEEVGLQNCNHPNELALKLKGVSGSSDRTWAPVEAQGAAAAPGTTLAQAGSSSGPRSGDKPDWMSKL